MYIKSLKLQNFRNYADESFAFDPAVNLICGENGQGKTNLLEAAAACSTMRLFRTAQKKEGLRFGENHAFIFADFLAQERDISLELRFSRTKAMEIYKNGVRHPNPLTSTKRSFRTQRKRKLRQRRWKVS